MEPDIAAIVSTSAEFMIMGRGLELPRILYKIVTLEKIVNIIL